MKNLIAMNITRARQLRGITMEELATQIDCSKQAISHYENGLRSPDSQTLEAISDALNVEFDYFYNENNVRFSLHSVNYREGMLLTDPQKKRVEELASELLNDYLELENIAKERITFENPLDDITVKNTHDAEKAAKQLRKKWKLAEGPIHNISNLLEKKGVRIIKIDFGFNYEHEGLSGWAEEQSVPVIILNARQQELARVRFTILHELGHLLLSLTDGLDINAIERICDAFAGAVLMPIEVLSQEFGKNRTAISIPELRRIKELYGMSIMGIMVRARMTNLISFDAFQNWKQSDFSDQDFGQFNGDEEPKRFLQMLHKCLAEKKIGFDKASKLARKDESEFRELFTNQQVEL